MHSISFFVAFFLPPLLSSIELHFTIRISILVLPKIQISDIQQLFKLTLFHQLPTTALPYNHHESEFKAVFKN